MRCNDYRKYMKYYINIPDVLVVYNYIQYFING